jgi:hypothetical protein
MFPIAIFNYPNKSVGIDVWKSGHTSTAQAIGPSRMPPISIISRKSTLSTAPVLFPFRDPVKRFVSAVGMLSKTKGGRGRYAGWGVNDFLDMLEKNTGVNRHFTKSSTALRSACFMYENIYLYKFPDHYENMLRDGGYEGEIPHENSGKRKPLLTESQRKRVEKIYENDIKIFNSIKKPRQAFDALFGYEDSSN